MIEELRIRAILDCEFHKSLLDTGIDLLLNNDKIGGSKYIEIYIEVLGEKWENKINQDQNLIKTP